MEPILRVRISRNDASKVSRSRFLAQASLEVSSCFFFLKIECSVFDIRSIRYSFRTRSVGNDSNPSRWKLGARHLLLKNSNEVNQITQVSLKLDNLSTEELRLHGAYSVSGCFIQHISEKYKITTETSPLLIGKSIRENTGESPRSVQRWIHSATKFTAASGT